MNLKSLLLLLACIGFILPNFLVLQESIETGNVLLYVDPIATFQGLFANRISSIFAIDLLYVVLLFFGWSFWTTPRTQRSKLYGIWLLTLLFGLASGFPLFLYLQEHQKKE